MENDLVKPPIQRPAAHERCVAHGVRQGPAGEECLHLSGVEWGLEWASLQSSALVSDCPRFLCVRAILIPRLHLLEPLVLQQWDHQQGRAHPEKTSKTVKARPLRQSLLGTPVIATRRDAARRR